MLTGDAMARYFNVASLNFFYIRQKAEGYGA
jgi:hypothetical protein